MGGIVKIRKELIEKGRKIETDREVLVVRRIKRGKRDGE